MTSGERTPSHSGMTPDHDERYADALRDQADAFEQRLIEGSRDRTMHILGAIAALASGVEMEEQHPATLEEIIIVLREYWELFQHVRAAGTVQGVEANVDLGDNPQVEDVYRVRSDEAEGGDDAVDPA